MAPAERRVLRLGKVIVEGRSFAFEPEPALSFEASAGEEVELAVLYSYRETSRGKEDVHLALAAEVDGVRLAPVRHRIKDRPMLNDDEYGYLPAVVRFRRPGRVTGAFRVEADYSDGPWVGAEDRRKTATFRKDGTFSVDVR